MSLDPCKCLYCKSTVSNGFDTFCDPGCEDNWYAENPVSNASPVRMSLPVVGQCNCEQCMLVETIPF